MSTTVKRRPNSGARSDQSRRYQSTPDLSSRGSELDRKTRQNIFFKCHACVLGHDKLPVGQEFSEAKSIELVKRFYAKRQSHNTIYCLEDRLRLEKSKTLGVKPYRSTLRYTSIQGVLPMGDSSAHPDAFVVWFDERQSRSGKRDRLYLLLKVKDVDHVSTICQLVRQAQASPDQRLRNLPAIGHLTVGQSMSSINSDAALSLGLREEEEEVSDDEVVIIQPSLEPHVESSQQRGTPIYDLVDIDDPKMIVGELNERSQAEPKLAFDMMLDERSGSPDPKSSGWEVSSTRFYWDDQKGCVADTLGPIYMYVATQKAMT